MILERFQSRCELLAVTLEDINTAKSAKSGTRTWNQNLEPESGRGCSTRTYGRDGRVSTNFWIYRVRTTGTPLDARVGDLYSHVRGSVRLGMKRGQWKSMSIYTGAFTLDFLRVCDSLIFSKSFRLSVISQFKRLTRFDLGKGTRLRK